jgi:hypothetical protein
MERKKVILGTVLFIAAALTVGVSVGVTKANPPLADSKEVSAATLAPSSVRHLPILGTNSPHVEASRKPTEGPSIWPSITSNKPSHQPSLNRALSLTPVPYEPVASPDGCHGRSPAVENSISVCRATVFYAVADVPYTQVDAIALPAQILSLPDNAEFLIHLGDIRSAQKETACVLSDYQDIAAVLKLSRVPVFLVPGGKYFCCNLDDCTIWQLILRQIMNGMIVATWILRGNSGSKN